MAIFHSYVSLPEGKYLGNHSLCLAPVFLFGESGGRKAKVPMNCWPWNSQGESLKLSKVLYAFRWICCQYWKWLTYIIGLYLPRTKHCQTMWLRDSKISKSFSHETVKRVLDTIRSSTNVDPHEDFWAPQFEGTTFRFFLTILGRCVGHIPTYKLCVVHRNLDE